MSALETPTASPTTPTATASPTTHAASPTSSQPSREYPYEFKVDSAYKATLPDIHNLLKPKGARTVIQTVGIANFKLPIRYNRADGTEMTLETTVTGSVSLEPDQKGINMSRIMRSFYDHSEKLFSFDVMDAVLDDYITDISSGLGDARLQMRFSYPLKQGSLRSGLVGYQYYDMVVEVVHENGRRRHILHIDYVYSSTCPCSLELSEHARCVRGQLATPHSQRSKARVSCVILNRDDHNSSEQGENSQQATNDNRPEQQEQQSKSKSQVYVEDFVEILRRAIPTETQVMVKREDEQAFAELNGANAMFVEDAVRLIYAELEKHPRWIGDFRVVASHFESLHSHDAVSVLTKGPTFHSLSLDPYLFQTIKQ